MKSKDIRPKQKTTPGNSKTPAVEDRLKWEIAEELGLADKVHADGWAGLTSAESGRIGGMVAHRKKHMP